MMLHKFFKNYSLRQWLLAGVIVASSSMFLSCDGYDLDVKQPATAGSSVYEYLSGAGYYSNYVRLIDDLGETESLSKTNLRTLFVADDEAFERFFVDNDWDVNKYEDLSMAQKKMLLYGSMIANSYQVAYLSSANGPLEGMCMRRITEASTFDTVSYVTPLEMPDNKYWKQYKENNNSIYCMKDYTKPPMIHFIEKFLTMNRISDDDCDFLMNYTTNRKAGDANINGVLMEEQNIRCMNGFVHRMKEVVTPLPNMAEKIRQKENTSLYSGLLERFSAPYPLSEEQTRAFNMQYGLSVDTVYQKRYFSQLSQGGGSLLTAPDGSPIGNKENVLRFDPGWNSYFTSGSTNSAEISLQENMAVMLVPSDEALQRYWNEEGGQALKDVYGEWENVPDHVVAQLITNNMLSSFKGSVPSKFETVLNDANDKMGLTKADVDNVYLCCNGAVYLTNRVFNPTAYRSVFFPALVNDNMNIIRWAVQKLEFNSYLNSMVSYYSFLIPTNEGMLQYIDPVTFGKTTTQLWRFFYDKVDETVKASVWNYDIATNEVGDSIKLISWEGDILNRLEDVLDTHIIVGDIEDGKEFYETKGGAVIRMARQGGENTMVLQGGFQIEEGREVTVGKIYDQTSDGNGKSYILSGEPIMTSRKAVYDILLERDEYRKFRELLEGSGYLVTKHLDKYPAGTKTYNLDLFNSYKYTVYVPTNAVIEELEASGKLPKWEVIEAMKEDDNANEAEIQRLTDIINNFIRYHVQDNSIYIGQGSVVGEYESQTMNLSIGRFYKLYVEANNTAMTVKGLANDKPLNVLTTDNELYNQMAREYQYDEGGGSLRTSSFAVVHLIDGALMYSKDQFK